MAVLTWRNVDAPDFRGVTDAYRLVGDSINKASTGMIDAIDSYQQGKTQAASSKLMLDAMKAGTAEELKSALRAGVAADPRYLNQDAIGFLAKYGDTLNDQNIAAQKLALAAAKGNGRGGGGSGRSGNTGKEDIVDVSGSPGIDGYIDANGQISQTPVAGIQEQLPNVVPATPARKVVVPAAPLAQEQSAVPVEAIASEPVASVLPDIPAGGPTLENAEQFTQALQSYDSAFGAPVRLGASGSLMPAPGPIRVGRPKGKDGGAQINPELTMDLGNARADALLSGDPQAALNAVLENPRVLKNLSATNMLDYVENTGAAAKTGQDIQEKGFKLRDLGRTEQDTVEARDRSDLADAWVADNIFKYGNDAELRNAIPRGDVKLFNEINSKLEAASGMRNIDQSVPTMDANGNVVLPDYLQKGTGGGDLPTTPEQTLSPTGLGSAATDEVVAKAADTPENAAKVEAAISKAVSSSQYAGRNLEPQRVQFQSVMDQIKLDSTGNTALQILTDFEKNADSTKSATDVANDLIAKKRFDGASVADVAAQVSRIASEAKINPALAGRIIENTGRDPYWVEGLVRSTAASQINNEEVNKYKEMFVDADGNPRKDIIQQAEKVRGVSGYTKKLNDSWSALQKAQTDLEDVIKKKGAGIGENTNVKVYEAAVREAQKQFDSAVGESKQYGYQNRGDYPVVEAPKPVQGPVIPKEVRDLNIRLENAARQNQAAAQTGEGIVPVQVIFNDLLANFKGTPTEYDKKLLLQRARAIANGRKVAR
jgi:hypothetical protein